MTMKDDRFEKQKKETERAANWFALIFFGGILLTALIGKWMG